MLNAIKELHSKNDHSAQTAQNNGPGTVNSERINVCMSGNKLITEYFQVPFLWLMVPTVLRIQLNVKNRQ
jgi:hypothetical protein